MELKEFIKHSLIEITTAVAEARKEVKSVGVFIAEYNTNGNSVINNEKKYCITKDCNFDIAVTTSKETNAEGKAGISVMSIGVGTKAEAKSNNSSVSRISFSIPITFETETRVDSKPKPLENNKRSKHKA